MTTTSTKSACKHVEIATSALGEVVICPDCGVVHVSMQSVSMRFDMDAFQVLSQMMSKAQAVIEQAKRAKQMLQTQAENSAQYSAVNSAQNLTKNSTTNSTVITDTAMHQERQFFDLTYLNAHQKIH
jgi:carbonic anhydrase